MKEEPLTAAEAIDQVLRRDMGGDPEWKLSGSARVELARTRREMERKAGSAA